MVFPDVSWFPVAAPSADPSRQELATSFNISRHNARADSADRQREHAPDMAWTASNVLNEQLQASELPTARLSGRSRD
jgi:hypothetical protein